MNYFLKTSMAYLLLIILISVSSQKAFGMLPNTPLSAAAPPFVVPMGQFSVILEPKPIIFDPKPIVFETKPFTFNAKPLIFEAKPLTITPIEFKLPPLELLFRIDPQTLLLGIKGSILLLGSYCIYALLSRGDRPGYIGAGLVAASTVASLAYVEYQCHLI